MLYRPLGFDLLGWQEQILRDLYGTLLEDGTRRYKRAYISVPKKQGKSFFTGGLPVLHLTFEDGVKAYGTASAKDQAGYVFDAAASLVRGNPLLLERLKVIDSTKRIVRKDGKGFYQVISADGDVQDGLEPSLLIKDELHRWKTEKARTLHKITTKGMKARKEPLEIVITTAGAQYESELWWDEYDLARKVLEGSLKSDRLYVYIRSADLKRIKEDPEYWKSREARVEANPSHEDHGGFLKDEAIVEELEKALLNPRDRNDYLRYELNVPLMTAEEHAIDVPRWLECGGGVDLEQWPEYDVELLVRKWGLLDKPCYAGVDASWTTDLSALALVFPGDDVWSVLVFQWMPADQVRELERRCQVNYTRWIEQGFIEATPGRAIDLRAIKKRVHWARELFELRELGFDPWGFRTTASELIDEDVSCVEVPQNFGHLSEATKKTLELYQVGKLRHGNNPALNWNASCLCLQSDRKDNVQPHKPERGKARARIDGYAAFVTAMARALRAENQYVEPNFAVI